MDRFSNYLIIAEQKIRKFLKRHRTKSIFILAASLTYIDKLTKGYVGIFTLIFFCTFVYDIIQMFDEGVTIKYNHRTRIITIDDNISIEQLKDVDKINIDGTTDAQEIVDKILEVLHNDK